MPTGDHAPHNKLLRVLGLIFGVAVVVGGMVGQGILRQPGNIARAVDSPQLILLLWIVGAGLVAISAFAYVELGTAIPSAGGPYDFVRRAYGPIPGVIAGWGQWFVLAALAATGTYQTLVAMSVGMTVALVVVVNIAAIRLRTTEPNLPRPFRIPLYPLPPIAAIALNLALFAALVYEDAVHTLEGFTFLAVVGLVYATFRRRDHS